MQVLAMVASGGEATHCMGADAPLAAMSTFAHAAYDYFKQRHAQVTNPAHRPHPGRACHDDGRVARAEAQLCRRRAGAGCGGGSRAHRNAHHAPGGTR